MDRVIVAIVSSVLCLIMNAKTQDCEVLSNSQEKTNDSVLPQAEKEIHLE